MFIFLLIVHILSFVFWLGGAMYETFFIVGRIKKNKGNDLELVFTRIFLTTPPTFLVAIVLLILSGIGLSVQPGFGLFQVLWLTLKQFVMILILIILFLYVVPRMKKVSKIIEEKPIDDDVRKLLKQGRIALDIIHSGVIINIILAVWKP